MLFLFAAPKDFMFRSKAPQFIGILRCEFLNQQKGGFMKLQSAQLNFAGQRIFVGLDVGKKEWVASILTERYVHKTFSQPPRSEVLADYLKRNFPLATYQCVYEAGYSGFWIQEELKKLGIDCIVINPADVPTTHKESSSKSDRVDARKLARHLRNGELKAIYIPSRASQEDRSLVRMRSRFVRKQSRCKNQIKALLSYYGYCVPPEITDRYWSRRFIHWIESLQLERPSGQEALKVLLAELSQLRNIINEITRHIRRLASEEPYAAHVPHLLSTPGIRVLSAMTLLTELVDIRRFPNMDRLVSYAGFSPDEHSSGGNEYQTGLTRRCNPVLRHGLIECAWVAIRKDPAMMMAFQTLSKRMPKNKAIIRIARKLLCRIAHMIKHHQPYQLGMMS
jgi:transposase